ncbi:MAG: hypothetical protein AAF393_12015 [Pseudomonadota bacterium]
MPMLNREPAAQRSPELTPRFAFQTAAKLVTLAALVIGSFLLTSDVEAKPETKEESVTHAADWAS